MRFYSFVANLYLSPLQLGLQTAHVIADMSQQDGWSYYDQWANAHKTIIICSAGNSDGVRLAYQKFSWFADQLGMPTEIFYEDTQSLNNAATACGIVVPEKYYNATPMKREPLTWLDKIFGTTKNQIAYQYEDPATGTFGHFAHGSVEAEFVKYLKSFKLA
jgi:hypothetical protein